MPLSNEHLISNLQFDITNRLSSVQRTKSFQGQKYHTGSQKLRYKCIPSVYVWFKKTPSVLQTLKLGIQMFSEINYLDLTCKLKIKCSYNAEFFNINCGLTL